MLKFNKGNLECGKLFLANGVGKIKYPHAEEPVWILTLHHIQNNSKWSKPKFKS